MRPVKALFIAGAASLVLAGAAIAAKEAKTHVMAVQMPDGSIQQIRYTGDVAPHIVVQPVALAAPEDMISAAFGPNSPFAEMERISAQMEAQSQAMLRQAMAAQQGAANGAPVTVANLPAGSSFQYTMVSTSNGNGCTQRVEISSNGQNQQPKVIKTSSGDCNVPAAGPSTAVLPNAAPIAQDVAVKPVAYQSKDEAKARAKTPSI